MDINTLLMVRTIGFILALWFVCWNLERQIKKVRENLSERLRK